MVDELRDDLDNAIEELSEETHGTAVHADGNLPPAEGVKIEEQGQTEETPAQEATGSEGAAEGEPDKSEITVVGESNDDTSSVKQDLKAPVGWSPKARENWSKLPVDVQQQITERESHIAQTMEQAAGDRKAQAAMNELTGNYAQLMATEGVRDPMQAISGLFDSANKMRNGSMEQRAGHIAGLVKYYGIDIGALDSALSGQITPQTQQNTQLEQLLDQRMAPINQFMGQLNQQQQQAQQAQMQQAQTEIAAFGGEFMSDLRMQMADLIDAAAAQGRNLSLEDAYNAAASIHPEISGILAQRKHDADLTGQQSQIANKRAAASTIHSGGQPATSSGDMSLREQLESAFAGG